MKNITLSADDVVIENARKKALKNNTTLNALFREWLSNYVNNAKSANELDNFLNKINVKSGRSFSRDELNER
jgi:hypothetical protein